ncbi:MAG TPA: beta-ketoacyl synthase N-terminal-like domain-containing protein, partial [Longimicrobiales bacterium]|nr:beta-ketoacyl synthase N-terminal-like domain-containing protein [Longimicrobiales bacterium]
MSPAISAIRAALIGRRLWEARGANLAAEPVAIIGMACRFPGGVDSPEAFWDLLVSGRDAITEVPRDRWDADALYDPDPAKPGRVSSRWGGFLDNVRGFDAEFFGITPGEAAAMDPQQRIALEVACEALEDAGVPFEALRGSATGVYFSVYHNDYAFLQYSDQAAVGARTLTGTLHSVLPNRISHVLGLHGPSVMVDSACSSSLVGVHLACQALRARDCDMAVVGGVNANLSPEVTIELSKGGFMSPGGRCRTFDAGADGFVRSEGCGAVVLKRLADAIADGDAVRAVIRGSAVNHDGESTTLSAPNGLAQAALVRRALSDAGVEPHEITLIEAHGTGTELGDPIEVDALAAVFGGRAEEFGDCYLGSLKANIGHPEAAAGVAGLIKLVLCIEHHTIPPHVHLTEINPHISLQGTPFRIAREATPWVAPSGRRLAGVSSFGVGGTNAHVVLEEPPAGIAPAAPEVEPPFVLAMSARSAVALRMLASEYAALLRREPGSVGAICRATARRRTHHRGYRAGVTGDSPESLAVRLDALADSGAAAPLEACPDEAPALCFVYSGQGTQRPGMGVGLMARDARFRDALERVDAACRTTHGFSVIEAIEAPTENSVLHRTDIAQTAIFAIQAALTEWLAEHGIRPAAVVGHSSGEIAAAYAAGMLTLDEALSAIVDRGRAMQGTFDQGRMLAVRAAEGAVRDAMEGAHLVVEIAAINSPRQVVVSGEVEAVAEARRAFEARGLECRELPVRFGFHSRLMDDAATELARVQSRLAGVAGSIPVISTVTGALLERIDGEYLAQNVRSTVRFADAVAAALRAGVTHFIELGPDAVLGGPVLETATEVGEPAKVTFAFRRQRDEAATAFALIGRLYEWGVDPDWRAVYPGITAPYPLPRYPWQHREYWLPTVRKNAAPPEPVRLPSPFPGRRVRSPALARPVFELDVDDPVFEAFADHVVSGELTLPGTAVLELIRTAAIAVLSEDGGERRVLLARVEDAALMRPIRLGGGGRIQVIVESAGPERVTCEVHVTASESDWELAATAAAMVTTAAESAIADDPATWVPDSVGEAVDGEEFYAALDERGYAFGPGFRLLESITCWSEVAAGRLASGRLTLWPDSAHPAAMDACAHLCIALLQARGAMPAGTAYLPWATGSYAVHRTDVEPVRGVARLREISGDDATFDVAMLAADGSTVARLDGWRLRRVSARPEPLRVPAWTPAAVASMRSGAGGRWLLLRAAASRAPDGQNTSDCLSTSIARELERAGRAVELVDVGEPGSWTPASPADWSTAGGYEGIVLLTARDNPTFPPLGAARSTDDRACRALLDLAGIFAEDRLDAPRLLVVTRGAQSVGEASGEGDPTGGSAVGLARAVRAERPWLRCTALDLDPAPGIRALPETEAEKVVAEALAETAAAEVALRGDARLVRGEGAGSFIAITGRQAGPIVLRHELPGTLDGIAPVRAPESVEPPAGHVVVRVEAAGVNFKDVLTALGEVPGEEVRGHEAAGEVVAVGAGLDMPRVGDRVLVYWPGCFASHVVVPVERVFPAPRGLAPAACATIPVAFGTAWYALHDLAHINANSRVLIHAGAGGVGLAAVQLAIEAGA